MSNIEAWIAQGLTREQALANEAALANMTPLPFGTGPTDTRQVDTFGDTAAHLARAPWARAREIWDTPSTSLFGIEDAIAGETNRGMVPLLAQGGWEAAKAGVGGTAGLLAELAPDFRGVGADTNERAFARMLGGLGEYSAGQGVGVWGTNPIDDVVDGLVDGVRIARPYVRSATSGLLDDAADVGRRFVDDQRGAVKLGGLLDDADILRLPAGEGVPYPRTMADVPSIRQMPTDDAISIARQEPHIIASGKGTEGAFIGGPRNFRSMDDVIAQREFLDSQIARGQDAGDWYQRYNDDITRVTGGNEIDNTWMANKQAQYSAGVAPDSELQFTLRDTNSNIAYDGAPVKAARPAQQHATMRATAANDPSLLQLGNKTGEYAIRVNPNNADLGNVATGVNDYRHARTLGFTEIDGSPQAGALGGPSHVWSDYETALAVDRANAANLGGRSNWTGPQTQAAPWVAQKADDYYPRRLPSFTAEGRRSLEARGILDPTAAQLEEAGREAAFKYANSTIGDFFPKHTANATYEVQPYVDAGHLPGLLSDPAAAAQYAADPRASWATAPGGRDALYAGPRLRDTGDAVRTLPTVQAQGIYTPPSGVTEFNRAEIARPLVAFEGDTGMRGIDAASATILDGNEATRAYVDVQGAGAWNKPVTGNKTGASPSAFASVPDGGLLSTDQVQQARDISARYGLPDVVDNNSGLLMTNFENMPAPMPAKQLRAMSEELKGIGVFDDVQRASVSSGYQSMFEMGADQGSGAVTRQYLDGMDALPAGTRNAIDNNPYLADVALNKLELDESLAARLGGTREDVQNARRIIGEGPGFLGRLRTAVEAGAVLPAIAAFVVYSPAMQEGSPNDGA